MTTNVFKATRQAVAVAGGILILLGLAAGRPAMATPVYYLSTGQAGAQTQIDVNHTTSWSFTATSNWDLGGGDFTMKDGSATTAGIMLAVYEGTNSSGILRASLSLSNSDFCSLQAGGNCQSYGGTPFHFLPPYSINLGIEYYIALTSNAADVQSHAYFIKGVQSSSFLDAQNIALPTQTLTSQVPADVPEPASLAILGVGFLGAAVVRARKMRPIT